MRLPCRDQRGLPPPCRPCHRSSACLEMDVHLLPINLCTALCEDKSEASCSPVLVGPVGGGFNWPFPWRLPLQERLVEGRAGYTASAEGAILCPSLWLVSEAGPCAGTTCGSSLRLPKHGLPTSMWPDSSPGPGKALSLPGVMPAASAANSRKEAHGFLAVIRECWEGKSLVPLNDREKGKCWVEEGVVPGWGSIPRT